MKSIAARNVKIGDLIRLKKTDRWFKVLKIESLAKGSDTLLFHVREEGAWLQVEPTRISVGPKERVTTRRVGVAAGQVKVGDKFTYGELKGTVKSLRKKLVDNDPVLMAHITWDDGNKSLWPESIIAPFIEKL